MYIYRIMLQYYLYLLDSKTRKDRVRNTNVRSKLGVDEMKNGIQKSILR
jgi:hypothetical protein